MPSSSPPPRWGRPSWKNTCPPRSRAGAERGAGLQARREERQQGGPLVPASVVKHLLSPRLARGPLQTGRLPWPSGTRFRALLPRGRREGPCVLPRHFAGTPLLSVMPLLQRPPTAQPRRLGGAVLHWKLTECPRQGEVFGFGSFFGRVSTYFVSMNTSIYPEILTKGRGGSRHSIRAEGSSVPSFALTRP